MKRLAVLGSTGSIGTQSLDIIDKNTGRFQVGVLSCGRRTGMLTEQIEKYHPAIAVTELEEDAVKVAADLKARGIKMTIASASMPGLLKVVFDRFNLYQYFPKIISCAEVGKGKSHPDVFIAAEKYLGTTRDDTWVFEDSFVALQTAKNAGFQTVGVFDKHNFGSVGVADVSTIYIGEGESFHRIIEQI